MSTKKKGANSSYVHGSGGPVPRGNMSSYVGSMSGSLQDNVKVGGDPLTFQKSPMLNTGKKMSNTSL